MTVQYVSESSEGQLQQLIDLVISATGKSPPEHRRNGMEAPRGDHESFVGQTHRRSFMLIPAPSLEPLIHPACLSLDGGSRPKQSTRRHVWNKKKYIKVAFVWLRGDGADTEIQLLHIQYTPGGITPSPAHIHQVSDNSHAQTHLSSWLELLDAASSDSVIRRRPVERGRVRMRQKRAQPQQGPSQTSHGSQLDGGSD